MASIRKRNGKWEVRIRHKSLKGKALSGTFTKKASAERWAQEQELAIEQSIFVDSRSANNILMAELFKRYHEELSVTKSPRTYKEEGYVVNALTKYVGNLSVIDCNESVWFEYGKQRIVTDKVKPDTVIKHLQVVQNTFAAALTVWNIPILKNPVTDARRMLNMYNYLQGANRGRVRRITEEEKRKINEYKPKRFSLVRWATLFAIETSMRREEITTMKWSALDLDKYIYNLPKEKSDRHKRVIGQGRVIPLSPKAIELLNEVKAFKEANQAEFGDYIWPWRDPKSLTQAFNRMCDRVGIDKTSIHFHDTRHEGISSDVDKGTDERLISAKAGQKDRRSMDRYTHPNMQKYAHELNNTASV